MVEYVCPDCNESFDHKSKFDQHRRRKKPCTPAAGGSQETQIQKVCACGRQYAPGGGFYAHAKKCESAIKAAVIKSAPSFLKQLQPLKTQLQNAPVDSSLRETLRSLLVSENAIKELQSDQQAADEASHSVVLRHATIQDHPAQARQVLAVRMVWSTACSLQLLCQPPEPLSTLRTHPVLQLPRGSVCLLVLLRDNPRIQYIPPHHLWAAPKPEQQATVCDGIACGAHFHRFLPFFINLTMYA
ncbi:hypothetical protein WJX72_004632 [[Myrmecia] bisecta]|uniref:C2H2-type domain-containing protein n=1 Tax=[Myrmecia] bisecta TaxID=41462 RepID=A0AAW1Q3V4_9CHLO